MTINTLGLNFIGKLICHCVDKPEWASSNYYCDVQRKTCCAMSQQALVSVQVPANTPILTFLWFWILRATYTPFKTALCGDLKHSFVLNSQSYITVIIQVSYHWEGLHVLVYFTCLPSTCSFLCHQACLANLPAVSKSIHIITISFSPACGPAI